jgi:protein tyrosine/serine phosphatase
MTDATLDIGRCLDDEVPGAVNLRDIGGHRTVEGRTVKRGLLYRAGMTQHLAPEGLQALRERLGIRTVIDLRGEEELEKDGVGPFHLHGIAHRHVPVVGATAVTPEERKARMEALKSAEHDWAESYIRIMTDMPGAYVTFFEIVADSGQIPAVFHCAAGRDRTGIAAALVLGVLGVPHEAIGHDYALTGRNLQRHVHRFRRHMEQMGATPEEFARIVDTPGGEPILRFLDVITERHGSVRSFVQEIGVTSTTITRVRALLLAD